MIAGTRIRAAFLGTGQGKGDGGVQQTTFVNHGVKNSQRQGFVRLHGFAAEDHIQALFRPDQSWQALGTTSAGNKAQGDFR